MSTKSKAQHKRDLLGHLITILSNNDDLRLSEDDVADDDYQGRDYQRWAAARDELVAEFERRSALTEGAK